jgi:chemotaxis protein histidine kinase CheA
VCSSDLSDVVVCIRDDGAGIDWARVATKAEARGLPHGTKAELEEALFADGLSTRDVTSEISGRGVGMGALRHAVRELGGRVEIHSRTGRGTTLEIRVPATIESLRHAA